VFDESKLLHNRQKGIELLRRSRVVLVMQLFALGSLLLLSFGTLAWAQGGLPRAGTRVSQSIADRLGALEQAVHDGKFVKVGSVLIAQDGKLVYERYFDGDASTLRDTRSATKSITDILVGIAIDDHKLSGVSAPVLQFFPGRRHLNPDPRKERITLEDFLTMSSPLECDDWNDFSRGNEEHMYPMEDWVQFTLDLPIRGYMKVPGETPPKYGRRFSYCTAGASLMSPILQAATGVPADQYAQKKLFDPLAIQDAQWVYSPLGLPQTGGGLRLSSVDLMKIAELYRNQGVWMGKRIVSTDWVSASVAPHVQIDDQTEYGYFWWLKTFIAGGKPYPAYFMSGNGGNKVVIVPDLKTSVVITSKNYDARGMHQQTETLLTDYVLPAVQDSFYGSQSFPRVSQ
jgi:CubicO group peptidase (beta-lactamase class C family)